MKAKVFLTDGFEMVEALGVVDLLIRAGIETELISVTGRKEVVSAQNVTVIADRLFKNNAGETEDTADLLFLPGGMGSVSGNYPFDSINGLKSLFLRQADEDGLVAAICAAPSVLGKWGLLKGKRAICFPGFEKDLTGALVEKAPVRVVADGNVITARGMGTALDLGLAIIEKLLGKEAAIQAGVDAQYLEADELE